MSIFPEDTLDQASISCNSRVGTTSSIDIC